MKTAVARMTSVSPYSQSKFYLAKKNPKELDEDFEKRIWREHCHVVSVDDDHLVIPPMAFKNSLAESAKFLSIQIPGKGKATWTKHFEAGVMVTDGLVLPERKSTVEGEWLFLNADGKKGGGRRVLRCYPVIPKWAGEVTFYIVDDMITQDVFTDHLKQCGQLIGLGRFRPRNGGYYGRFRVDGVTWNEM